MAIALPIQDRTSVGQQQLWSGRTNYIQLLIASGLLKQHQKALSMMYGLEKQQVITGTHLIPQKEQSSYGHTVSFDVLRGRLFTRITEIKL